MQRLKPQIRAMPIDEQQRQMRRYAPQVVSANWRCRRRAKQAKVGYAGLASSAWRNGPETPWLKDAPASAATVAQDLEEDITFLAEPTCRASERKRDSHYRP